VLVVVVFELTWVIVRHIVVMAHEGAHAIFASLSGRGVKSIKLKLNGDGATTPRRGGGVSLTTGRWRCHRNQDFRRSSGPFFSGISPLE